MKMFQSITDKILQINLFGWAATAVTDKIGLINLSEATQGFSQEHITKLAVTISAVTGAVYGVYRVCTLIGKGFTWLLKKIKQ